MNRHHSTDAPQPASVEEPLSHFADLTLIRLVRKAMATGFEVALPLSTYHAVEAGEDALDLLARLEEQMTVYRGESEVSRFNQYAALSPMPVEAGLFEIFEMAERIHRDTGGAYDLATGALIKTWGFFRRQGRVPAEAELRMARECSGMHHVELDPVRRTIHLRARGVELNLGSVGKGYALDRMAVHLLERWNVHAALLHGGTSSVFGRGFPPGQPRGWQVGLGHPFDLNCRMGSIWLRDRALGTSSATFQHLLHEGRKLGHILDPRTGWPATGVASASAIASTAAEADALATAFFVLGVDQARVYCQKHPEIGAVLLTDQPQAAPIVFGAVDGSGF
jgi:FAD:protein FMN transferase